MAAIRKIYNSEPGDHSNKDDKQDDPKKDFLRDKLKRRVSVILFLEVPNYATIDISWACNGKSTLMQNPQNSYTCRIPNHLLAIPTESPHHSQSSYTYIIPPPLTE